MKLSKKLYSELLSLGFFCLLICTFKSVVFCNYTIPTGSMEPIILPGDKIWVNRAAYNLRVPFTQIELLKTSQPKRGDVIVFIAPPQPEMDYTKRLIGLPGDKITVMDGKISVNDKPLEISVDQDEFEEALYFGGSYTETLDGKSYTVQRLAHIPDYTERTWIVPEGHYFAMGDNRDFSDDSRSWGFVPHELLKGKATITYFSVDWPNYSTLPKFRFDRIGNLF